MKDNNNEAQILELQIIATVIYVGSLFLSILLTYNDRQISLNQKRPLKNTQAATLSIFNRTLVVILTLVFLYTTYQSRENAKRQNQKIWPFDLQLYASELTLISTIIVLYVVIKTAGEQYAIVPGVSNPTL